MSVDQAAFRAEALSTRGDRGMKPTKVRAGFYRVGPLCIHKGHRWCTYDGERLLERHRTLDEAAWWAADFLRRKVGKSQPLSVRDAQPVDRAGDDVTS